MHIATLKGVRTIVGSVALLIGLESLALLRPIRAFEPEHPTEAAKMKATVMFDISFERLGQQVVGSEQLAAWIEESPDEHRTARTSRTRLRARAVAHLAEFVDREVLDIHQKVNDGKPEELVSMSWLKQELGANWRKRESDERARAFRNFDGAYDSARKRVVDREWEAIKQDVSAIQVSEQDVELWETSPEPAIAGLRRDLGRLTGSSFFEENKVRVEEAVALRLRNGARLLQQQRKLLEKIDVPGATEDTLLERVTKRLEEISMDKGFGVFPSVGNVLRSRVQAEVVRRLQSAVSPSQTCVAIDREWIRASIEANPTKHSQAQQSLEYFSQDLKKSVLRALVIKHLEKNEEESASAPKLLEASSAPDVAAIYEKAFASCLEQTVVAIRTQVASSQVDEFFPGLKAGVASSEGSVLWFRGEGEDATDAQVLEQLGWSRQIALPELVEEAIELAATRARRSLREGIRALDAQLSSVETQRPSIAKMRRSGMSRQEIRSESLGQLRRDWNKRAQRISTRYLQLFGRTIQKVDDVIDNVFSEVEIADIKEDANRLSASNALENKGNKAVRPERLGPSRAYEQEPVLRNQGRDSVQAQSGQTDRESADKEDPQFSFAKRLEDIRHRLKTNLPVMSPAQVARVVRLLDALDSLLGDEREAARGEMGLLKDLERTLGAFLAEGGHGSRPGLARGGSGADLTGGPGAGGGDGSAGSRGGAGAGGGDGSGGGAGAGGGDGSAGSGGGAGAGGGKEDASYPEPVNSGVTAARQTSLDQRPNPADLQPPCREAMTTNLALKEEIESLNRKIRKLQEELHNDQ